MKTIKELENEDASDYIFGYNDCRKDVLKLIDAPSEVLKTHYEEIYYTRKMKCDVVINGWCYYKKLE